MSSELQLFCYSQKFLYRDFYIFKKNELVLSSPKKFGEGFPRFRRGISALLLFLCSSKQLFSERDPCTGIPYSEKSLYRKFFFFWKSLYRNFPDTKKKSGGEHQILLFGSPPLQKPTGFFSSWSLTKKKWSEVFARFDKGHFFIFEKMFVLARLSSHICSVFF